MNTNNGTISLGKPRATRKDRSAVGNPTAPAKAPSPAIEQGAIPLDVPELDLSPLNVVSESKPLNSDGPLDAAMVSGFGKFATDNDGATPENLTAITFNRIRALADNPAQGVPKDSAQWVIPSLYQSRKGQKEHGRFVMLWLDIDQAAGRTITQMADIVGAIVEGCDFEIYASRSATEQNQKCRVLVPLSAELTPHQWLISEGLLRSKMADAGVDTDPASEKPGQVLYLPNTGDYYATAHARNGYLFQPLVCWAGDVAELKRQEAELEQAKEAAKQARQSLAQSRTAQGFASPRQAFNAAYDVASILLQNGYEQRGNTFKHPASQTGSYSASVKDGRVHTLSTSDPLHSAGAGAHDAFSAWCVLEHGGDENAALKDAGDNRLSIGGESWNTVKRREYMQNKSKAAPDILEGFLKNNVPNMREAFAPIDPETGEILAWDEKSKAATPPPNLGFEFVPIGEMLKSPAPVTYLVDELIEHPSMGLIFGPHSCGKSFITLSMAACVATGTPWMDRPTTQGAVFYLAGEGHAGLSRRLMGWSIHSGVSLENAPLFISKIPAQLMNPQAAADVTLAIEAMAKHYGTKPALIVIDTFARNMGDGDENASKDTGLFISHIDKMRAHVGATVLLVHHSGHNPEAQDRGRGSSAVGAAMDCIFQLTKDGDHITVIPKKTKEDAIPKPIPLKLAHPVELPSHWIDAKGRVMSTAVAVPSDGPPPESKRLTPAVQLALDTYHIAVCESGTVDKEARTVSVNLEDWRAVFYEKSTADSADAKRTAFNTARKGLAGRGMVTVKDYVYTMPDNHDLQIARLAMQMQKKAEPQD